MPRTLVVSGRILTQKLSQDFTWCVVGFLVANPPFSFLFFFNLALPFFKVRVRNSIKPSVYTCAMHEKVTQFKGFEIWGPGQWRVG